MKIMSCCTGYATDHSSSTYEFYSLDRLTKEQKEAVESLTGQRPRGRNIGFQYWGDFQDIPSGWVEKLLSDPYDIMASEILAGDFSALRVIHEYYGGLRRRIGRRGKRPSI